MSAVSLELREKRDRLGLKGPRAAEWLAAQGVELPMAPNTWMQPEGTGAGDSLLVARLGTTEFFLEDGTAGAALARISPSLDRNPPGVYPVLREDWAFRLGGNRVHDVLAQVCNVNFAALPLASRPVIMTLMIGVAVLVVPQSVGGHDYLIWCDPTFGPYLGESLGAVVIECGGRYTGVPG
jgi:sarcosine oxidase, subunit gamma